MRTLLTDRVGLTDVATYIQSGNVGFSNGDASPEASANAITAAIADHFGFDVPVVVRSVETLVTLLERSADLYPPDADETHVKRTMVGSLTSAPTPTFTTRRGKARPS